MFVLGGRIDSLAQKILRYVEKIGL